jgi:flagellar operon protein
MSTILYPSVTQIPKTSVIQPGKPGALKSPSVPGEFDQALDRALLETPVREPLKFSAHASERLKERKIGMNSDLMAKINGAVDKATSKGLEEALILTDEGAFIVGVKNRTVITALDRGSMNGNVFTNIDGAVIA